MEQPTSDTASLSPLCVLDTCPGVAQSQPPGQVDLDAPWSPSAEPPHYRPDFLPGAMPGDAQGPRDNPPSNGYPHGGSTRFCGDPVFTHDDYKDKYPEDAIGGECGHSARVWRMFYDETRAYDMQMANNHRENLDVVIVLSGFFSAVVALFLTQASQKLDINYGQMTSLMVFEMVQLQRAALSGASDSSIPVSPVNPDTPFLPPTSIILVNNLWLTSMALSLATAFLAVLAKHWIHHYMSLTSGTARDMARLRQFRFTAFMKWHVPLIINLLPAALNVSFVLFSIGLVVFALNKECSAGYAVAAICTVAFLAYVAAIVMPTIDPQIPYATPLSEVFCTLYHNSVEFLLDLWAKWNMIRSIEPKQSKQYSTSLQALELKRVQEQITQLDPQALLWLYFNSTKNSVHEIIIESIGGLSSQINSGFLKSLFKDSGIWEERQALLKNSLIVISDDNIQQRPVAGLGSSVEHLVRFQCQLDMRAASKEVQKVVILPEDWEPSSQKYTNKQVEMMATVACAGQDDPLPSGYPGIGQVLHIISATSDLTLPAYVWTTIFDRTLEEKGPTLFPVTAKELSTYEIFLHNIVINASRCKDLWDSNNHVELDETFRGFTLKDALSAGLFQRVGKHILASFAPFDTYREGPGSSASYAAHLRVIICLLNYLTRKPLPEPFRCSQSRRTGAGRRSSSDSHSGHYVLLSNDGSEHTVEVDSSCCTTETQVAQSPFIDHPILCDNCLRLLFEVLQDFHLGITASEYGASKRDREIITDLMGRLIHSAVFTGPVWLPVANIPAGVQADDGTTITSLANIRQCVITSAAIIVKNRHLPGWELHRKGAWIVNMMRRFFDRELVCDNLAWYCQVYDMECFLTTFRHMSLILEYTWADSAERHTCDAFVDMDVVSLIRDSQLVWFDWMRLLYRFVSGISTSLAQNAEAPDSAPTQCQLDAYVEYLYQPDNLFTVCLNFSALFAKAQLSNDNESETGLLRLMRLRPNDPAWPQCISRMQAFATRDDPTAIRVDRDAYLCVHTFQLQTYTAETVGEIETRVRKYAGILQGWMNDGLPAVEEPLPPQEARCVTATKVDNCDSEAETEKEQSLFSVFRRLKLPRRRQSINAWNNAVTEEEKVGDQV